MSNSNEWPAISEEKEKAYVGIKSDIEAKSGENKEIKITLENGVPKAIAFFDIDKTLAECGFTHGPAIKELFKEMLEDKENLDGELLDEIEKEYLSSLHLGTTYRVFHRMLGIYKYGHSEWKDLKTYEDWLQTHKKEVDESGEAHDEAAECSMKHSAKSAEIAEGIDKENPEVFEQAKIKPVFHLVNLYKRLGIPMVIMTANDPPFAKFICKILNLGESFLTMANQKDFEGHGKDGAMEFLADKLKKMGISMPRNLIVVGDSLKGDIGSGSVFESNHKEYNVKGVFIGKNDIEEMKEMIKKNPDLKDMEVEVLNPEKVLVSDKENYQLAKYRRKFNTKI
ncbi:MAG: HAD family hydrolase [Patescibacteria group bacterium]